MRNITVKYLGNCRKCDAELEVDAIAVYERHVGIFCPSCAPTDTEEIRMYRQEAGNRRAEKYEGWADKRTEKAMATINHNSRYTDDIAFNTQPGHIPLRARVIAQNEKAHESLNTARKFEAKADSLRKVRVAGDAEKKHQAVRDYTLSWLKVGLAVMAGVYGEGTVKKINRKTTTICNTGSSGSFTVNVDLSYISKLQTK